MVRSCGVYFGFFYGLVVFALVSVCLRVVAGILSFGNVCSSGSIRTVENY